MATATTVMNTARVIVVIDPGLQVYLELDSHLQPNALGRSSAGLEAAGES